jgi:hypothetical protein
MAGFAALQSSHVPLAARLENQRQQTDDNKQTNEKDNADRSADEFQHDCLLFVQSAPYGNAGAEPLDVPSMRAQDQRNKHFHSGVPASSRLVCIDDLLTGRCPAL